MSLVIVVRCPHYARARPRPLANPSSTQCLPCRLPIYRSVGRRLPVTEWNSDTTPSITWTEWTPGARKWKTLAADYPATAAAPRRGMGWRMRNGGVRIKWIQPLCEIDGQLCLCKSRHSRERLSSLCPMCLGLATTIQPFR